MDMCYGRLSSLGEECEGCMIRPIITLKSSVLDISNVTADSGKDGNAWRLK